MHIRQEEWIAALVLHEPRPLGESWAQKWESISSESRVGFTRYIYARRDYFPPPQVYLWRLRAPRRRVNPRPVVEGWGGGEFVCKGGPSLAT